MCSSDLETITEEIVEVVPEVTPEDEVAAAEAAAMNNQEGEE